MNMHLHDDKLIRIGVFYDGNYFAHVSNYYNYEHERKSRLSISGLHEFIRERVAEQEDFDVSHCKIVDAHYFRGRLNAHEYNHNGHNRIINERVFDDILMSEGVITHYLPLRTKDGRIEEAGVDVWMALEAFELALHKRYNVIALIACNGDFVPLVRKLNTLGVRVMVLGWDFEYTDERTGRFRKTVTSADLMHEATYPIAMHEEVDAEAELEEEDYLIDGLFIPKEKKNTYAAPAAPPINGNGNDQVMQSTILSLKNGYGFINMPPNNLYFHYTWMADGDFNDLEEGDYVQFTLSQNANGQDIAVDVRQLESTY